MLEARARHYGDLMSKIKGYEDKNQMLELQKIKNNLDQKQRKQGIQNNREQWMMGNHNTKKDLDSLAGMLKDAKNQNDEADMDYKKQVWRSIMSQKMGLKQIKNLNEKGNELNLMNQYGEKMIQKKERQDGLKNRISQMEEREQMLLSKLQQTQSKQRAAYSSLESMVSVGYDYYS